MVVFCVKESVFLVLVVLTCWKPAQEIYEFRDDGGLQTVIPPFSDIHFHWVQDRVSAMAKGKLLEWLENFVFPEEQKFSDKDFTRQRAMEFPDKLFRCGTLSGAVYSSIHSDTFAIAQEHFRDISS